MAAINVSEEDFCALSEAANTALKRGDRRAALALDKVARKINAALSNARGPRGFNRSSGLSWTDVPSTLMEHHDGG